MNDYAAWTALTKKKSKAVADQDIQIKGGGGRGAGHPDTEIIGGAQSQKVFFGPSGLSLV